MYLWFALLNFYFIINHLDIIIRPFFEEIKGIMYVRPFVGPSVCPSGSNTLQLLLHYWCLNHQTYMHDTPMHTDVGNVIEICLRLPVLKYFRFSDFTQKFLCELFKKLVKKLSVLLLVICNIYQTGFIIWLLDHPEIGNIDIGGGKCNFSLTILKENFLLLQLPINFSENSDARIGKHACMVPISIVIMATHLKKFPTSHFDLIQILVI